LYSKTISLIDIIIYYIFLLELSTVIDMVDLLMQ